MRRTEVEKEGVMASGGEESSSSHWKENEVLELLAIRGEEEIKKQLTGTVKDSQVFVNISTKLRRRGVNKTKKQVIYKLKSLRAQYNKVHDHNRNKSGHERMEWALYEKCNEVFGNSATTNPIALSSSLAHTQASANIDHEAQTMMDRVCTSPLLIDESPSGGRDTETSVTQEERESSFEEVPESMMLTQASTSTAVESDTEPLRRNIYQVPPRRKRLNKTEQATRALTQSMFEHLDAMDRVMTEHDDRRAAANLLSQKELLKTLVQDLATVQERLQDRQFAENRQNQALFLDRLSSILLGASHASPHYAPPHYAPPHYPPPHYAPPHYAQNIGQAQAGTSFQPQPGTSYKPQPQPQHGTSSQPQPQPGTSYQRQPQHGTSSQPQPQPGTSYQPQHLPQYGTSLQPQPQAEGSTGSHRPYYYSATSASSAHSPPSEMQQSPPENRNPDTTSIFNTDYCNL